MSRIFSGIQPTGDLQLGNYLGALRNWVALQNDYECIYCIVDLHAITLWQDPANLAPSTREVTAGLIASGLDPKNNVIFNQSAVPAHAELAWVFNCVARLGWLNRMTQFKDKAGSHKENASAGLYVYPNLMAADILLYKATHVPVGEDQKQHLELARDIAQKFNNDYDVDLFPLPEPLIFGEATRVMSLKDGSKKMSKSDPSPNSRINMTDGADEIARKIKKATSDQDLLPGDPKGLEGRPEAANLMGIYAALSDKTIADVCTEFEGQQFSTFKAALTDVAVSVLGPIGDEMARLVADPGYLDGVLKDGSDRAKAIADPILAEVFDTVGFLRP
ncbi:MAG: tryptophan--tRNA ligase [Rhodospirillaceae bacterium]|jgi:tryptophanyl-tRNA synthetase|nr:tryptophan--tRNA ligase [Rhodospirillaceae bacterium]MBT4590312.1 tryptophan--tRNA ligase [Rhodospirillaceae bacterium]MBT4940995.1 tryptophan--tRNA ligase [Rhodospirillaceae bacterium]MBT5938919.1 tryptophan--tRNA ligase [Rhodospirillaceae bacterium]MBT7268930.1 tryptophan--tRNA ligase [Rhodospirillaceae bacterium]